MSTRKIKFSMYDNLIELNNYHESYGAYSDSLLLSKLQADVRILPNQICVWKAFFAGGQRTGLCMLYEGTKQYGWVMVFHYNNAPRFFTVNEGNPTVRQFATS